MVSLCPFQMEKWHIGVSVTYPRSHGQPVPEPLHPEARLLGGPAARGLRPEWSWSSAWIPRGSGVGPHRCLRTSSGACQDGWAGEGAGREACPHRDGVAPTAPRQPAPRAFGGEQCGTCNLFNSVRESVRCLMKPLSGVRVSFLLTRPQEARADGNVLIFLPASAERFGNVVSRCWFQLKSPVSLQRLALSALPRTLHLKRV